MFKTVRQAHRKKHGQIFHSHFLINSFYNLHTLFPPFLRQKLKKYGSFVFLANQSPKVEIQRRTVELF